MTPGDSRVDPPWKSWRPLFFEERQGTSFSRANSLRPLHTSVHRFLALSTVCEFSMVVLACVSLVHFEFDPDDPWAFPILVVSAAVSLAMGVLTWLMLSLDLLNGRNLDRKNVSEWKFKLRREEKSYRYVAQPKHLRGITIGAVFFGLMGLAALCVQVLVALGVINLPK